MELTIDSMGRILIPKPMRNALRLTPGSKVDVSEYGGGLQLIPGGRKAKLVEEDTGRLALVGEGEFDDEQLYELLDAGRR